MPKMWVNLRAGDGDWGWPAQASDRSRVLLVLVVDDLAWGIEYEDE
jgi:hypothetical protein